MSRSIHILAWLFAVTLPGCAMLAQTPSSDNELKGRVESNHYISPQGSFRVRLPRLAQNATLKDEIPTFDTLLVMFADALCREFIISQRPGYLGTRPLEAWVDEHIVQDLKRKNLSVESKILTTHNGPAVVLRYRAPAVALCSRTTEVAGKKVETKLDADVGWHIYHRAGHFYRLLYVIGTGNDAPSLWYVNREPVDEVRRQFAEGFETLDARDRVAP